MEQKKKNSSVLTLTECAVMLALAVVLSFIKVWKMPMGGAVTLVSMLPIIMVSIKHGNKAGVATAFLFSLIQLVQGIASGDVFVYCETAGIVAVVVAFDYIVPFTVLGFAGSFRKLKIGKFDTFGIYLGIALVIIVRFCCHYITGFSVWGQWAEGMSPYMYSLLYNGTYMLPELIFTLIVSAILIQVPQIRKLLGIKIKPEDTKENTEA